MVHILPGGEVVSDDDPRVAARRPPADAEGDAEPPPESGAHAAAARLFGAVPAASRPTFGMAAPFFALEWGYAGPGGGAGLPAFRVFGALLTPATAAALAMATVFVGLPGIAFGALVWALWKYGGPADPAPRVAGDVTFGGRLPAGALRQYQAAAATRVAPAAATTDEVRAATRAAWARRQEKAE